MDKDILRGSNINGPVPGMGRITGSASIETLVRVGIEKENGLSPDSKMVVLHDFTPCVDDELTVKRGQVRKFPSLIDCTIELCRFFSFDRSSLFNKVFVFVGCKHSL